ncbi:MAG: toxin-antitoxin system HicB family antitoxin [Mycobacteriaceae bacterium]
MNLDSYTDTLREDLVTAASLGDDATRATAAALAGALEPAARLLLMNALSDLAAEVTAALDDRVVEVRLDGRDLRVVVSGNGADEKPSPQPAPQTFNPFKASSGSDDVIGDVSRVTLRMVEQLKARAEEAATRDGVSLNSWLSQAVQGALREPGGRPGGSGTLRGWVRG